METPILWTSGSPEQTTFGIEEDIQYCPINAKISYIVFNEKSGKVIFYYTSFSKILQENFMIDYIYHPEIPRKKQTFVEWLLESEPELYKQYLELKKY